MSSYKTQLRSRETVAEGTMAFKFAKPDSFVHLPGQALTLTLINPPETDSEGNARMFTIASAPHEPELMIATRMRNTAFKRVLRDLPLGTDLLLDGPEGEMVLDAAEQRPLALLAGGIGITPFLAMARHALETGLKRPIYLFYANRSPEDSAFLDELSEMGGVNPNFHLIATMSNTANTATPWRGETGYINPAMLARHLPDLLAPIYCFAGPPAMTLAMGEMLDTMGVAAADMHFEAFDGY